MTIKSKTAAAVAVLTLAAALAVPTGAAQAKAKFGALGVGLLGAVVVGGAIAAANAEPVYVDGYSRCFWKPQYDAVGNYLGNARVCRYY
jgi:hypothetical protein